MGDLGEDTAVRPSGRGRFEATLSPDWEIWGPMGGYVAACALRAVGASTEHPRPAAFSCHYLGVARFAPVDIRVISRKEGRMAAAHRVEMEQEGRPILDAMVWSARDGVDGLEHDETVPPDVPGPHDLPNIRDLLSDEDRPPYPFWNNLDAKPVDFEAAWPPSGPRPARWQQWLRFTPTATFADPWIDAVRSLILVDLPSWPSAHRPHAWKTPPFTAPTLDLNVAFHAPTQDHEWLLCDGAAPLSTAGLFGWTARVWSPSGQLHASGGGQCLYRRLPT
ncbi:MAG TPA: thioesterase family protein [Acidimicrobiales bacterium]|jgi:acyl-CoA thioesterase-2|nr:thioesterase family protein [Acidimicrobiales bacterium]